MCVFVGLISLQLLLHLKRGVAEMEDLQSLCVVVEKCVCALSSKTATLKIVFKAQSHPAKREGKWTGLFREICYTERKRRERERAETGKERRKRKREVFAEILYQGCKRSKTHNHRLLLKNQCT